MANSRLYVGSELQTLSHVAMTGNQKKVYSSRDVSGSITTLSRLVHDVIDTECWAQNVSTHDHVFATFKRRFLTNGTRNGVKNCCVPG